MKIRIITFLVSMTLALGLTAMATAQSQQQQSQSGQMSLNSCLQNLIQSKINADPELKGSDIQATVEENKVTLSGSVASDRLRDSAVRIAKETATDYTVADTIDVQPGAMARADFDPNQIRQQAQQRCHTIGQSQEDVRIYSEYWSKLSTSGVPTDEMKINVTNGVLTLQGNVPDENAKRKAQEIAQQTQGINQVKNELAAQGNQPSQQRQ
jgi:osmotically-inducible protein OsmY